MLAELNYNRSLWVDSNKGVTVRSRRINHLPFVDDLVLLTSSEHGLQHALDQISAVLN